MSDETPQPDPNAPPENPNPEAPDDGQEVIGTHTIGDTEGGDGREVTGEDDRPDKRKVHDPY